MNNFHRFTPKISNFLKILGWPRPPWPPRFRRPCSRGSVLCKLCRPFHYPEDHGGVKPKELSPFVGRKSEISEKLDQN